MTARATPTVSVVIATYNRAELLDECLTHVRRQPFRPGDEVLVVDNGSTDGTPQVIGRHQAGGGVAVRHLHESQPGKSRAVARALAVATGDILAFTDDDVNVDATWLDAIRTAMIDPDVALIGGPVAPRWAPAVPRWMQRAREQSPRLGAPLALLDYGPESADLGTRTVLGANMAVRRDVIARLGGFAPHLGKLRGTLLSGEDHELCRRVQAAGSVARYCPTATVRHWVPADRARVGYFLKWFYWSGITNATIDAGVAAGARAIAGVPLYLVRRGMASAARALAALAIGRRTAALDAAVDVAFAAGYAAQRWGLIPRVSAEPSAPAGELACR